MKATCQTENNAGVENRIIRTAGEILPDRSVLELVASPNTDRLDVLLWNGTSTRIGAEIEHGGCIYRAEELLVSIRRVMHFPREPVPYGTTRQLLAELAGTFENYLAFSEPAARQSAHWVISTWFPDCVPSPPSILFSGADIDLAAACFDVCHCLCRRAVRVSGVTRAGFLSLPMAFHPALLLLQPSVSRGLQSLWCESNFRGFVIPGSRGTVVDASSSKAVFLGLDAPAPLASANNLHVALVPPDREVPRLDERTLNAIAEYFQPRLLQYRLDHLQGVRESGFMAPGLPSPARELARNLGACIQGDAELALEVVPLLLPEDDIVVRCNLDIAIIRCLWPRVHRVGAETAATSVKIEAELTVEVNTFLFDCGETLEYTREGVGIRVAKLGFTRKRTNAGTLLLLDRQTSLRVHQLARSYRINKSVAGCPDCQPVPAPAE